MLLCCCLFDTMGVHPRTHTHIRLRRKAFILLIFVEICVTISANKHVERHNIECRSCPNTYFLCLACSCPLWQTMRASVVCVINLLKHTFYAPSEIFVTTRVHSLGTTLMCFVNFAQEPTLSSCCLALLVHEGETT